MADLEICLAMYRSLFSVDRRVPGIVQLDASNTDINCGCRLQCRSRTMQASAVPERHGCIIEEAKTSFQLLLVAQVVEAGFTRVFFDLLAARVQGGIVHHFATPAAHLPVRIELAI